MGKGQALAQEEERSLMGDRTKIEYVDATLNPVKGCSHEDEEEFYNNLGGCDNCWAERQAARFSKPGEHFHGLTKDGNWTGQAKLFEKELEKPNRWTRSRRIAICLMGDLFHQSVPDEWIDKVFEMMFEADHHVYLILTKRPERMAKYVQKWVTPYEPKGPVEICVGLDEIEERDARVRKAWLPPHIWCGVSVENQEAADLRIPHLLRVPARIRFLSLEPLLGPVKLRMPGIGEVEEDATYPIANPGEWDDFKYWAARDRGIQWVIVGGESGPGARPMHPRWVHDIKEQCEKSHVSFFFKQWGAWIAGSEYGHIVKSRGFYGPDIVTSRFGSLTSDGQWEPDVYPGRKNGKGPHLEEMYLLGKKKTGKMLGGEFYNAIPEVPS